MDDYLEQPSLFPTKSPLTRVTRQHVNLLALSNIKGIGDASLKALFQAFPNLDDVWEASRREVEIVLANAGLKNSRAVTEEILTRRHEHWQLGRAELARLRKEGVVLLTIEDAAYPDRLHKMDGTPLWLFVQGNIDVLSMPNLVAVVGTRDASPHGLSLTRSITAWLAQEGFGIVSGLAEGVDQVAHQTALDYGVPTIGVLGTGIYITFPAATSDLRKRIVADGGAVITEYLPHDTYSRARFVQRNRIQAGLAYATVPVEAQARSGTAHTYRFSRAFKRFTFGVEQAKGSPSNGILELFRQDEVPVFKLDSDQSMQELRKHLEPALHSAVLTPTGKRFFGAALREVQRIIDTYPVEQSDMDDFKADIEELWRRASSDG